jgi:hypothetical protein
MFLIQYSVKDSFGKTDPFWETKAKALTFGDAEMTLDWLENFYTQKLKPELKKDIVFRIKEE